PAPRPVAWLLLVACAAAIFGVGLVATIAILAGVQVQVGRIPIRFWAAAAFGALLTCASVGLRTFRWMFLLRRTGVRIPLRDASIGYLSGFSLLFVPLLVAETVVHAAIHKSPAPASPPPPLP